MRDNDRRQSVESSARRSSFETAAWPTIGSEAVRCVTIIEYPRTALISRDALPAPVGKREWRTFLACAACQRPGVERQIGAVVSMLVEVHSAALHLRSAW